MTKMELELIGDGVWYDSYSKIVYYMNNNGDLIDMGMYDKISDSENPFSTNYFFDKEGDICYFDTDIAKDICRKVYIYDKDNARQWFEMKYVAGDYIYNKEEEGVFELDDETWVYEINADTELPIFFSLEDAGKTEIEPQFNKEKDIMYYTLLLELDNDGYIDRYIERMKTI